MLKFLFLSGPSAETRTTWSYCDQIFMLQLGFSCSSALEIEILLGELSNSGRECRRYNQVNRNVQVGSVSQKCVFQLGDAAGLFDNLKIYMSPKCTEQQGY